MQQQVHLHSSFYLKQTLKNEEEFQHGDQPADAAVRGFLTCTDS